MLVAKADRFFLDDLCRSRGYVAAHGLANGHEVCLGCCANCKDESSCLSQSVKDHAVADTDALQQLQASFPAHRPLRVPERLGFGQEASHAPSAPEAARCLLE